MQNANGSWDWTITNATSPTSTTYMNIAGITAESLLNSYKITGNISYLTAAEKTGNYLLNMYTNKLPTIMVDPNSDPTSNNINSVNVKFLYDLGNISRINSYTTEANLLMNKVMNAYSSGSDLLTANKVYRGTSNEGLIVWDLYNYIDDAKMAGNSPWANSLINTINTNSPLIITNVSDPTYIIGLVGLVEAGNSSAKDALIVSQQMNGSWSDANGYVQDTAYAIMALMDAGDFKDAINGQLWLTSNQNYKGIIGGWYDSAPGNDGTNEVSEVNSESVQAVYTILSQANIVPDTDTSYLNLTSFMTGNDSGRLNVTVPANIILTSNDLNNIQVVIPSGTNITGNSTWDGTLNAPQVLNVGAPAATSNVPGDYYPNGFVNGLGEIIDVGGNNLNFSQPVNITIPGVTGKHIAYSNDGGLTFTQISANTTTDLETCAKTSGICYYDNGTDTIISTMHFTEFMTYLPTVPASTISGTSTSAGGGGGGASYVPPTSNANTTNTNTTITNISSPIANTTSTQTPVNGTTTTAPITGAAIGALTSPTGIIGIIAFVILVLAIIIIRVRKKNKNKNLN